MKIKETINSQRKSPPNTVSTLSQSLERGKEPSLIGVGIVFLGQSLAIPGYKISSSPLLF